MAIITEKSLLAQDISDILKAPKDKYEATFQFSAKLHTVAKDLATIDGIVISNISIYRDYVDSMADYIEIQFSSPLGLYVYDIYPYLDNIEVSITTQKQLYQGKKPFIRTERYKAVYLVEKNNTIPTETSVSKEDLNQHLPISLTLQLIDRSAETIRVKTVQGNFHKDINPKNTDMHIKPFLKSIISEEVNRILIENKKSIDFLYIEEPDDKEELKAITIPSYTRIVEIPDYIQNDNIGIYNGDVGTYIQLFGTDPFTYKKIFFIYSLYKPSKYDKSEYKGIFYAPTSSSLAMTDITYKYKDKILKVLPNVIPKIEDTKESDIMSTGGGFRTSNSNSYMKKPVIITTKGPVFSRNQLNTEIIYKDRADNLNLGTNKGVSNNHFKKTSEVMKKDGSYLTIDVNNLDHDFLYPGMPIKINYEDKNKKVKEIYGVVHKAVIKYSVVKTNIMQDYTSRYVALTSQVKLQVFINPNA